MIEHTPGDWALEANGAAWNLRSPDRVDHFLILLGMMHNNPGELKANAQLVEISPTAPHECSDSKCPGNENRRRLEAFDGLLEIANSALLHWTVMATDSSFSVAERQGAREKAEAAREIIASEKE